MTGASWRWPSRRRGNFDFRSLVSTCEFAARDAWCEREFFGLRPMATYWWSCLKDDDGNFLAPMRKVNTELSSGLQLSSNVGAANLEIAPEVFGRSQRGAGARWSLAEDESSFRVVAPATPYSEPFDLFVADDEFSWREGDLLDLHGARLGLGYQWYTPNVDERGGNLYVSQPFRVAGQVAGRAVHGFVCMDNFYGPVGQVYNNGPIFNVVELAWVTFGNFYADGAHEFGALCLGKEHWGFAVASNEAGPIIQTTEIAADVQLDADRYVSTALYRAAGTEWRFTAADRGQMRSLAAARGDTYHGQAGSVRRVGDDRTPVFSAGWIETFPLNGLDRTYSGPRR